MVMMTVMMMMMLMVTYIRAEWNNTMWTSPWLYNFSPWLYNDHMVHSIDC